jgi:hypothetical protein
MKLAGRKRWSFEVFAAAHSAGLIKLGLMVSGDRDDAGRLAPFDEVDDVEASFLEADLDQVRQAGNSSSRACCRSQRERGDDALRRAKATVGGASSSRASFHAESAGPASRLADGLLGNSARPGPADVSV